MTFQELLKACSTGVMPQVSIAQKIKFASNNVGTVTNIKQTKSFTGCAVKFTGCDYETWFYEHKTEDKRMHHMGELTLIPLLVTEEPKPQKKATKYKKFADLPDDLHTYLFERHVHLSQLKRLPDSAIVYKEKSVLEIINFLNKLR